MRDLWQTINRGEVWRGDMRNRIKNGSIFWTQTTIVPFLDKNQKPYQFYAIRHNITERKQIEEKNQLIVGALTDLIFILDYKGTILDFHASDLNRLMFQPSEFLGKTPEALFPPELAAQMMQLIRNAIESNHRETLKYRLVLKSQIGYYEAYASRLDDNRIITIIRDVTEQRLATARLREHAALLDHARDAIHVRSLDHRILYWNDSCTRLYGYSREEVIGKSTRELLYADPTAFDCAHAELLEKKEFRGDLKQITKDKRELIVQMHWTLVADEDDSKQSIFCINSDVTEQRKTEQQFLRAQRLESIGTLASGIAHDLNNILTPILLAVEVLKTAEMQADQKELIDTVELSARRGASIVKQVLSFARGADGNRVPMQVTNLLKDIENIIKETFPKNIRLTVKLPQDVWSVYGDETQLHQVVMNLVVNARDAMPKGGELLLGAENQTLDAQYVGMFQGIAPGKFVVVRVEDSGVGMSAEVIERIFEPFFTTKDVDRGTGLGLSTSIGIVKAHGGIIRMYSEPKKGSRFHVYLPAWQSEEEIADEELLTKIPRGKGEKILVVDDEAPIRKVTRQTLEMNGYRVETAQDGAEAIAVYAEQKNSIQLVVTDMMMPVMDGLGTIQVLRKMNPKLPIIVASGLDANGRLAQLSAYGIKFFLPKPYSSDTLLKTIYQALNNDKKISNDTTKETP